MSILLKKPTLYNWKNRNYSNFGIWHLLAPFCWVYLENYNVDCYVMISSNMDCHMMISLDTSWHMISPDTGCHVILSPDTGCHVMLSPDTGCHVMLSPDTDCHVILIDKWWIHLILVAKTECIKDLIYTILWYLINFICCYLFHYWILISH